MISVVSHHEAKLSSVCQQLHFSEHLCEYRRYNDHLCYDKFCRSKYRSNDLSFAIATLARYRAKKLTGQRLRSAGIKVSTVRYCDLRMQPDRYLAEHRDGCNENQDIRTNAEDPQIKGFGCANVGSKMMIIGYARVSTRHYLALEGCWRHQSRPKSGHQRE
jgi:hypothetical protein